MKITKNFIECRDPISHRSQQITRKWIDKKKTESWERHWGLIMKKNVYLVWENSNTFIRPYRVSQKDYGTLKEKGII